MELLPTVDDVSPWELYDLLPGRLGIGPLTTRFVLCQGLVLIRVLWRGDAPGRYGDVHWLLFDVEVVKESPESLS